MMERVRCFIAVDFSEETRTALSKVQHDILKLEELKSVKAVSTSTLHVTLNFLGEITRSEVEDIGAALSSVSFHPFCVTLDGLSALPSVNKMRVIYVGVTPLDDLVGLSSQIEATLPKKYRSSRTFNPHVTLARVKKRIPSELQLLASSIQKSATYEVARCNIDSFQLKKSTLTPQGPIYETLKEYLL
ncbi:MAG: RNA 2',3'-cyclic phosphodiesterase [Halobacteriota archaeon]